MMANEFLQPTMKCIKKTLDEKNATVVSLIVFYENRNTIVFR